MQFPSRRARVAMLAGAATLAVAAPASAAPTAALDPATGLLTVSFAGTDSVEVGASSGNVSLNGTDTGIAAGTVRSILVQEDAAGTGANTVDLSAVDAATYTALEGTTISARGGVDTLIGSQRNDRILGGTEDDIMRGRNGDDTLVWNPGEGSDVMDGENGTDTIENNGGNGAETFKASPLPSGGMRFERVTPAPFVLTTSNAERLRNNMNGGNDTFSAELGLAPFVISEINGGDGDDTITGTDGNDTLNGGIGNDRIDGARGNDAMNGDDGDDLLIWNNGDGSDRFEGGAGNDIGQDNGAPAGDRFVVTANNGRVSAVRTNLGLFFLDIGTTETLDVNGLAGDDTVDVGAGLGALIKVDIDGGEGNDIANLRNGAVDTFLGGAGADTAVADGNDLLTEVETADLPVVAPPADTTDPRVALKIKRAKLRNGRVAFTVRCPAGEISCTGTLRIVRNGKTVGRAKVELAGGERKTIRVALNKAAKKRIRAAGKAGLQYQVRLSVKDAAGNAGTDTLRAKLRR